MRMMSMKQLAELFDVAGVDEVVEASNRSQAWSMGTSLGGGGQVCDRLVDLPSAIDTHGSCSPCRSAHTTPVEGLTASPSPGSRPVSDGSLVNSYFRLALATFARLGIISGRGPRSHRIVSVEVTEEAERRGLALALPASIEVTMVGDTGFEPVTSRM